MLNYLSERYKTFTKRKYFNKAQNIKKRYAFIGTGSHARTYLYPVLQHLGIPLAFIFSKHFSNSKSMCMLYKNCEPAKELKTILDKEAVEGVFVCTDPSSHYNIVKQLLEAGKNVFVEKPACKALQELNDLLAIKGKYILHVNFQQRFSPAVEYLKKITSATKFYRIEYLTGIYPEGNPINELFIHPLDLTLFLFDSIKDFAVKKIKTTDGITFLIQTEHNNGIAGELKLSTAYSWQNAQENIEVFAGKEYYTCNFPHHLKRTILPSSVLGLPFEKLLRTPVKEEIILNANNISTSSANHTAWLYGFYQSIESFIDKVENGEQSSDKEIQSLIRLYQLMEKLEHL